MATTPAHTPTTTIPSATSANTPISPTMRASQVRPIAAGNDSMIEKKISRLIPLPIPRSWICSPSHITKSAPVVSAIMVVKRNAGPGVVTAPGMLCRNTAKPYACISESRTVV